MGGKILQMGARLIESTAQKYTDDFFKTFNTQVTGEKPVKEAKRVGLVWWILAAGALAVALLYLLSR